jgi:hypothetical protein
MDDSEKRQTYWGMYTLMRQEITQLNQDVRRIQLFTIVGIGAAYSYLFTNASSEDPIAPIIWFIVPLLVLVAWLPSYNIVNLRKLKIQYLRMEIETKIFGGLEVPGWETYSNDHPRKMPSLMKIYWPALFVITLGIALSRLW